jgi:hypothetical protein
LLPPLGVEPLRERGRRCASIPLAIEIPIGI